MTRALPRGIWRFEHQPTNPTLLKKSQTCASAASAGRPPTYTRRAWRVAAEGAMLCGLQAACCATASRLACAMRAAAAVAAATACCVHTARSTGSALGASSGGVLRAAQLKGLKRPAVHSRSVALVAGLAGTASYTGCNSFSAARTHTSPPPTASPAPGAPALGWGAGCASTAAAAAPVAVLLLAATFRAATGRA